MSDRPNSQGSDITEWKKVQQKPLNGELAVDIIEAIPDGVAMVGMDSKVTFINKAFEKILGYNGNEIVGISAEGMLTYRNSKDEKRARQVLKMVVEKGSAQPVDMIALTKDGREIPISFSASAIKGDRGNPKTLVAVIRDITEQKKAEEALRESESKLKLYLNKSPDAIYILDAMGNFLYGNIAAEKTVGYSREELLGRNFVELSLLSDEQSLKAAQLHELNLAGKPTGPQEYELIRKDGSRVFVEISTYPMGEGDKLEIIGVARDITERRQMEEALRESELLATATIEGMSDGVMLVGMDGKVAYVNKAFEKMLGYVMEALVGTSAVELPTYSGSRDRKRARQALKKVIEKGSAEPIDMIALSKDGMEIPINFSASVIKDAKGNPKTLVAVIRDVTERRKAEDALRRSEEYFRALMENSLDAVTIMNEDGTIRYESPSYEGLLGFKPEERMGSNLFERIHPNDITRVAELFAGFLQNRGGTLRTEVRTQHKDGSWHFIEAIGSNLLDNSIVKGLVVNLRDITERRKMEETLQQSELNYRVLFDSTLDGLFVVDSETMKVVLANESGVRMAKIYGFDSLTDLNIADMVEFFHPEDRDRVIKTIAEDMFEKDLRQINEFRMLTKDGREMWISVVGTRTKYQGKLAGLVSMRDVTERKQMEEELRRLSDAVKMTSESIAIADLKGRIVDINEAGLRMYSLDDRADLVGKNPFNIIVPEDQPKALENMSKIVETGSVKDIEYHIMRKDGNKALIETSVSLIKGEKGEPKGIVAVARDITERRRMEDNLKESEERFRAIFDNSVDGILVTDLETNSFYTCNKAMCQMLGYNLEEVRNLKVADIHPKKDLSYVIEEMERERQGESPGVKVLPLVKKDGSVLHAEVTPSLVTFAGRHYLAGIFRDITGRKQAEEALRMSEERYRQVVDNAVEAIVVAQDGMLKFFNPRVIEILGYSKEEMASKPFIELVHPDDQQMVAGRYMARLGGEELPSIYSFRVVDKAGNFRWVEINAVVINWEGRPATLNFLTDITERKKAEEEQQRMEEQLHLAAQLAAVGELAAGVAHELNNPLAIIQMYSESSKERGDLDDTAKKDLLVIHEQAERASKITRNLLSFARKHEPEKNMVSVNEIIERTLEMHSHQLSINNIEVSEELQPGLPMIMADYNQMQQVFMNIIINAEQAMLEAHGRGKLNIKTETTEGMIKISFTDDGPGISEGNLKRIFDPFFTTKEVGKGTGLGLSICYGIVQAHGGHIYAISKMGEGATFVIEIPITSEY